MTLNFWIWLRGYSNEKIRKINMSKIRHERRCERCDTWTSEVGGAANLIDDPEDPYCQLMTCKKCGHVSKWDCSGMLPELVKSEIL